MKGYIYVLSNESMPGVFKVGRSINGGATRAKQIYQTGVPTPFQIEFEILVNEPCDTEILIHEELAEYRVSPDREFFKHDLIEIIKCITDVCIADYGFSVVTDIEQCAAETIRTNHIDIPYYNKLLAVRFIPREAFELAIKKYDEWLEGRQ